MPKNKVSDPITDQEMAFARLILSGTMTDRQAAEAAGLKADSAAYTKSKPHVRAYMLEHRAAVQQQFVQQEADGLHRLSLERQKVLDRLWEIAYLSPEMTRNSVTGQVKALSMIIAMQNFIPDRRAVSSEVKSTPAPTAQIYASAWLGKQQATTIDPHPTPTPTHQEDSPAAPEHARGSGDAPPEANPLSPSQPPPATPYGAGFSFVPDARGPFVPDTRVPFSIKKNPFARPR